MTHDYLRSLYARARCGLRVKAADAMRRARAELERGEKCFQSFPGLRTFGNNDKPDASGGRFIYDALDRARFIGWADDIAREEGWPRSRVIEHGGWYSDDSGDLDVYVGAVFKLPGARGFVPAYARCEQSRRTKGGREARETLDEGFVFMFGEVCADKWEAAKAADHAAEGVAEKERDYNAAYEAAARVCELRGEIKDHKQRFLKTRAELRQLRRVIFPSQFPQLCAEMNTTARYILGDIREAVRDIAKAREESEWRSREGYQNGLADNGAR